MRTVAAGLIGLALALAPAALAQDRQTNKNMDADMQRAIQFERNKDAADARQAEIEKKHPTVAEPGADRSVEPESSQVAKSSQGSSSADREDMNGASRSAAPAFRTEPTQGELSKAVAWEHFKDAAAARQAAAEGHGSSKADKDK